MNFFKSLFADLLAPHIPELTHEQIIDLIEIPPQWLWADLAFPCFSLAKSRGQSPVQIAQSISSLSREVSRNETEGFSALETKWPYINLSFSPSFVFEKVMDCFVPSSKKTSFGARNDNDLGTKNQELGTTKGLVLIESPSPNTNKPLHLGHVRNMILWNALAKIMTADGYEIKKVEVINDRGIHICKSMLAYQLRGNNAEPDKKSDHFVGDRYVRYATEEENERRDALLGRPNNPTLQDQAQEMLRKREAGDPEVKALWHKMNTRAISWMRETYKRYGTHIDDATLESDVYNDGKQVAEKGLVTWVFVHDPKGNIALPLPINEEETSYFVVLRADGTTLYSTQDLALVDHRFKTYHMDKMVYIVGNEQDDYFKALFKCFQGLEYPFADQCHHLSYGMIELPNGKMKSRTGNVIDADNLIEELHERSVEELQKRYPDLDESEAHQRAEQIALWAINFFMLRIDAAKWFVFDPAESLSFEWETGPYIQYTYARAGAILTKASSLRIYSLNNKSREAMATPHPVVKWNETGRGDGGEENKPLLFHISQLSETISKASSEYKPHLLCRYALDLCQMINSFYQQGKILDESNPETSAYRLTILQAAHTTLSQTMDLILVPKLDVM